MADTAVTRMRRSRAHARGDHSLCLPSHCTSVNSRDDVPPPTFPQPGDGRVTDTIIDHLTRFQFAEGDPRGVLSVIAVRLAQQLDQDGRPGTARELRHVLSDIGVLPDDEADVLDELQLRRHVRIAAAMLDEARQNPAG